MRLKWLPVRLRRRRGGVWEDCGCSPRTSQPSDHSALLRGAGQRQSSLAHEGVVGGGPAFARGAYSPASGTFRRRLRRAASPCRTSRRRLPLRGGLGRSLLGWRPSRPLPRQWPSTVIAGRVGCWSHLASWSLVPEWPHPTRLETRTKECNMRASLRVANPWAQ